MRIPRIYDEQLQPTVGSNLTLSESGTNHVSKVLRLKIGDHIVLFDGKGHECQATLTQVGKTTCANIDQLITRQSESPLNIELLQVLSRGDRMDFTIQKAVELGIKRIVPLTSERCGVKLDTARAAKKIDSYQKIVISACEQCGRNVVPPVMPLQSLSSYLKTLKAERDESEAKAETESSADSATQRFINITLDPRAQHKLTDLPATGHYRLLIGPEGGFTETEVQESIEAGFVGVTLGPRILRTETTALVTLAILGAHFGDL